MESQTSKRTSKKNVAPTQQVYNNYQDFIGKHTIYQNDDGKEITNTRINGGKFHIPQEVYPLFLQLYNRDIVSKNGEEFLTEKQLEKNGPIVIDIDLHYEYSVKKKQYTTTHINKLIQLYLDELKMMFQFNEDTPFQVYIMEKPNTNPVESKNITKDGIHIIIGIQADRTTQVILRSRILEKIEDVWGDLNDKLVNDWESIFDEGISKGHVNWQLYGSKKPNHEKYVLTQYLEYVYDESEDKFIETIYSVKRFDFNKDFAKLSVRYTGNPSFFYKSDFILIHDKMDSVPKRSSSSTKSKIGGSISNKEELDQVLNEFLDSLKPTEYEIREAHQLVMILPTKFYSDFDKWMRVGWALHNISTKLFITWVAFSSKWENFNFSDIPELAEKWSSMGKRKEDGLTKRSINYWAKENSPEEYYKIIENSIEYAIENSLKTSSALVNSSVKNIGAGDVDIARILYMMYKQEFACAGLKTEKWYRFSNHRWVEDEIGTSLRAHISKELREAYLKKSTHFSNMVSSTENNADKHATIESLLIKTMEIVCKLSDTRKKDNVMKEAREMFYDPQIQFLDLLDSNRSLLCFENGVIDIKAKQFRPGRPEDYISKSTKINYIKIDYQRDAEIIAEIEDFMSKVFPVPELKEYMWDHLASILLGGNQHQKLHMYNGKGSNGKSVLMDLMSQVLGDYKTDAPLSLFTQPRQKQGTASPDIVALKGCRLFLMNEPCDGDVLYEGPMKEYTSCVEPIKGRNLFGNPITFIPQGQFIICTNTLLKVKATDHGTWRRINAVEFVSHFCENPEKDNEDKPYQFKADSTLVEEKFPKWREVFMSMLVERVFKTQGKVKECKMVTDYSNKYKEREDVISEYISDRILYDKTDKTKIIKKTELSLDFKQWYETNYGRQGQPNIKKLHDHFNKAFGDYKQSISGWSNVKIVYHKEQDSGEENVEYEDEPDDPEL